jgi:hypothetical protein
MKIITNSKKKLKSKAIIILVECLPRALKAGRFALKHLYEDQDQIILLQVYKIQGSVIISDNIDKTDEISKDFLANISKEYSLDIEYITGASMNSSLITDESTIHLSNDNSCDFSAHTKIDEILQGWVSNSIFQNGISMKNSNICGLK